MTAALYRSIRTLDDDALVAVRRFLEDLDDDDPSSIPLARELLAVEAEVRVRADHAAPFPVAVMCEAIVEAVRQPEDQPPPQPEEPAPEESLALPPPVVVPAPAPPKVCRECGAPGRSMCGKCAGRMGGRGRHKLAPRADAAPDRLGDARPPCVDCGRPGYGKTPVCANCRVAGRPHQKRKVGSLEIAPPPIVGQDTVVGDGTGGLEVGRTYARTVLAPAGWADDGAGAYEETLIAAVGDEGLTDSPNI